MARKQRADRNDGDIRANAVREHFADQQPSQAPSTELPAYFDVEDDSLAIHLGGVDEVHPAGGSSLSEVNGVGADRAIFTEPYPATTTTPGTPQRTNHQA
ncbi:hypothetical protein [Micromonospora sp. DT68]|uniref:hypothetical protein n=1 Tax=Micromonospora TaxID=1873 RepID=UPI003CEA8534